MASSLLGSGPPRQYNDALPKLPTELILEIFKNIDDPASVAPAAASCRKFRDVYLEHNKEILTNIECRYPRETAYQYFKWVTWLKRKALPAPLDSDPIKDSDSSDDADATIVDDDEFHYPQGGFSNIMPDVKALHPPMFFYSTITEMDENYLSVCVKRVVIVENRAKCGPGDDLKDFFHESGLILTYTSGEEVSYELQLFMMDLELTRGTSSGFGPHDPQYFRWGEKKLALIDVVEHLMDAMLWFDVPEDWQPFYLRDWSIVAGSYDL